MMTTMTIPVKYHKVGSAKDRVYTGLTTTSLETISESPLAQANQSSNLKKNMTANNKTVNFKL